MSPSNNQNDKSKKENLKETAADSSSNYNNDIDEELLALAPPPPSIRHAVFIILVIIMSVAILVWFYPDLKFLLSSFEAPEHLGEASEIDSEKLVSNKTVSIDGLPIVNAMLTFNPGKKWFFEGKRFRKMAPLSGQSNILVQWPVYSPKFAKGKGPISPPSYFEGRLVSRASLGPKYKSFWTFFDCLETNVLSRCKYCIGDTSMDNCRSKFSCLERNSAEECSLILSRSTQEVQKEINGLKQKMSDVTGDSKLGQELTALNVLNAQLRAQKSETDLLKLEETAVRIKKYINDVSNKQSVAELEKIYSEIVSLNVAEARIRGFEAFDKLSVLNAEQKAGLKNTLEKLNRLRETRQALTQKIETLEKIRGIKKELASFVRWAKELETWLANTPLDEKQRSALVEVSLDPSSQGENWIRFVSQLYSIKTGEKVSQLPVVKAIPADAGDFSVDAGVQEMDAPDGGGAAMPRDVKQIALDGAEDKDIHRVLSILKKAQNRISALTAQMSRLTEDNSNTLLLWLDRPTVIVGAPNARLGERVFKSLNKIEKIVADTKVDPLAQSLKSRLRALWKQRASVKKEMNGLDKTNGLDAFEIVRSLELLQKAVKSVESVQSGKKIERELIAAKQLMIESKFYVFDLEDHPKALNAMEALLKTAHADTLNNKVISLVQKHGKKQWVLLHGAEPSDNPLVIFVYFIMPLMIILNLRRLLHFWKSWRS